MNKDFEIYKLTNKVNNKVYVGVTTQGIGQRFKLHCWKANEGSNYPLHQAIREFGADNFRKEILEIIDNATEAREKEKFYIKVLDSQNTEVGYNTTEGGEYFEVTDEMRKAMSSAQKGRRHVESFKAVLQYTKEGKFIREFECLTDAEKLTGISRASISRTLSKTLKKPSKSNPYIWVLKSEFPDIPEYIHPQLIFRDLNYKPTMSEACLQKSRKYRETDGDFSKHQHPVVKCDLEGNEIEEYTGISEAAKANGMTPEAIRCHLRGKYDYTNPKVLRKLKFIWKEKK